MTNWLVHTFIKDYENIEKESVRLSYGLLSSIVGIIANIGLFVLKLYIGLVSSSIAIMSDAFNNLSDALSCVVTLFGYRLAAKPADKEHPFGHGRMEYVVSFIMTIVIFVVGYELLSSSISRMIHPQAVEFRLNLTIILACSILVKVWLAHFNRVLGKRINNLTMEAVAKDAANDVLATSVTLVAMLLGIKYPHIPFDGIGGIVISGFIFYSGYDIGKEIIGKLLGSPASREFTNEIEELILSYPEIIGVHDMIIHDYGPGVKIGSAHAEVDADMDFRKAHDVVDRAEKNIAETFHILMTLHLDPIEVDNPEVNAYRNEVTQALHGIDERLSLHDFRMVKGDTHTNLVFDVLIPFDCSCTPTEIQDVLDKEMEHHEEKVYFVLTFDHEYINDEE